VIPPPDRDLSKLDPTFRARVDALLQRLSALGFDPMIWEAWRSLERCDALVKAGTGVHRSMHHYGLAVDIVHAKGPHWGGPATFWAALRDESEAMGLTSGARFTRRHTKGDGDHVQALPANCDDWVRNATAQQIAERVALHLAEPAREA
jgi:hypothetical protein